jgi:hypothetical protein
VDLLVRGSLWAQPDSGIPHWEHHDGIVAFLPCAGALLPLIAFGARANTRDAREYEEEWNKTARGSCPEEKAGVGFAEALPDNTE